MRKRKKKKKCILCKQIVERKHGKNWICANCSLLSVRKNHLISVIYRKGKRITHKICPNCGIKKELEGGYGKRRKAEKWEHDWHKSWCKQCYKKYGKQYREKNKEKAIEYARAYRKKDGQKEKNAAYMREYRRKKRQSSSIKTP